MCLWVEGIVEWALSVNALINLIFFVIWNLLMLWTVNGLFCASPVSFVHLLFIFYISKRILGIITKILLCNVINGSNIDNDAIWFMNDMNDPYIFSLRPHILVQSSKSWPCVSSTWCLPSPKLNPHWNLTLTWKDMNDISIHRSYVSS